MQDQIHNFALVARVDKNDKQCLTRVSIRVIHFIFGVTPSSISFTVVIYNLLSAVIFKPYILEAKCQINYW